MKTRSIKIDGRSGLIVQMATDPNSERYYSEILATGFKPIRKVGNGIREVIILIKH